MSKRIHALIVSGETPFPPSNGMRIPTWNMIRHLPKNWNLSLHCVNWESIESKQLAEDKISQYRPVHIHSPTINHELVENKYFGSLKKLAKFLFQSKPSFALGHPSPQIIEELEDIFRLNRFDVVIFDAEYLAIYADWIPDYCYKVISPNDSISLAWLNELKYRMYNNPITLVFKRENIRRAILYETKYYSKFDLCHFVSEVDSSYVKKLAPQLNVVAIGNGVEIECGFSPVQPSVNINKAIIVGALVGGNLRYTMRFLDEVWRHVLKRRPEMELTILSRVAPSSLIKVSHKYNMTITDYGGKLGEYFQDFGVVISPVLKDCGILNKVLEGMAYGRVVIGYSCSFSGIPEAKNSREVLSAAHAEELIELLVNVVTKREEADFLGRKAIELVSEKYVWKDKILEFSNAIESNLNRKSF